MGAAFATSGDRDRAPSGALQPGPSVRAFVSSPPSSTAHPAPLRAPTRGFVEQRGRHGTDSDPTARDRCVPDRRARLARAARDFAARASEPGHDVDAAVAEDAPAYAELGSNRYRGAWRPVAPFGPRRCGRPRRWRWGVHWRPTSSVVRRAVPTPVLSPLGGAAGWCRSSSTGRCPRSVGMTGRSPHPRRGTCQCLR